MIKEAGYDYIVASRLKNASKEILDEVFNEEGYKRLDGKRCLNAEEIYGDEFKYKVLERTNIVKDEEGKRVQNRREFDNNVFKQESQERQRRQRDW